MDRQKKFHYSKFFNISLDYFNLPNDIKDKINLGYLKKIKNNHQFLLFFFIKIIKNCQKNLFIY